MGTNAGCAQGVFDFVGQLNACQAQRRAINGNAQVLPAQAGEGGEIIAGLAQYPVVEPCDQPVGFGDADKALRAQQAVFRVLPANQGLQLGNAAALEVEDGLVMQEQPLVFIQRMTQLLFNLQLQRGPGLEVAAEKIQGVTPAALGLIQRQVGMLEQFCTACAVFREYADADAGGHYHLAS